jgi:hypothetical protein
VQHFASRTSTSSTPSTLIPYVCEASASRAFGVFRGIASSSATASVFRRWMTLLTMLCAVSFPEPSAR